MTTKDKAKEKLKQLIQDFKEGEKYWDTKPEADIKHQFIEPLFEEVLGWDRKDVLMEARVLRDRADYILKNGNQETLVIEAKKSGIGLLDEEGRQAVSYAYHRKIKFAVLTNFKCIKVFHALSNIKNISNNLLKKNNDYFIIKIDSYIDKFDLLWLLSKESVQSGELNKLLSSKDEKINKPIDARILDDLLQIRQLLSKDLKSKRMELKEENIDEIVQIFIDRLIFMRSVEDRRLEAEEFLLKIMQSVERGESDKNLWALLKEQFVRFDNTYNSKLFSKGILEEYGVFSDDILKKVIKTLYFGVEHSQEKYMFDEIPGDLFGSIYEQYLGTILAGTEKRVKLDSVSGKRKKMGIYYTPSYIVDYIVKNTVGEYINGKTIDEILNVKILDPACGSGSFLIRAFKEICDVIENKLKKGEEGSKILFKKPKEKLEQLNFGQKIEVLRNCIFGVDLDEKAVELAQLNLLLKCLEGESRELKNRKLPNLLENIKCGNSLIDDPKVSDRAFKWQVEFKDVMNSGGFDVVVGNPPYIFARSNKFNDKEKEYYYNKYKLTQYQINTYLLFNELGINLLKNNGKFGFIIPNTWQTIDNFSKFRKYIFENMGNIIVINSEDKIFGDANVDTGILLLTKLNQGDNKIKLYNLKNSNFEILFDGQSKDLGKEYILNFSGGNLNKLSKILSQIEKNSVMLNQLVIVKAGLKAYETGKGKPKQTETMKKDRIYHSKIQKDKSYYEYLEGKDVQRYNLNWGGSFLKYGECLAAPRIFDLFNGEGYWLDKSLQNPHIV